MRHQTRPNDIASDLACFAVAIATAFALWMAAGACIAAQQPSAPDYSDSGVGCVADCLAPAEGR